MSRRRFLGRLAGVPALALLAATIALFVLDAQRHRLSHGLVPAPGTYDVRILRDRRGVPHIFGRRDADVAYGLAWAHAEDDFATLQGSLLAARGQLASVYGAKAAPNDYMVQLLRIDEAVRQGYPQLPADVRAVLEAYAHGLGHYAALHPDQAHAELYPLGGADVVRGFVHKLPLFFGLDSTLEMLFAEGAEGGDAEPAETTCGSNVIAVGPSRTNDGSTFLVVNSHQPWEGPVAWYEAHLHSEEGWDMVGGVFPGAPLVLHGHNRYLGWAHTVNRPDLIDLYRLDTTPDGLDVEPEEPIGYRLDGRWHELEKRLAPIAVKLWGPLRWTFHRPVYWSEHGPVVVRRQAPEAGVYALRYAGMGEVRQIEQWFRMNKAHSFEEWRQAMAMGALPMFNTGYADRDGRVFYVYNAQLPVRTTGYDYQAPGLAGALPGDTSDTLWSETLPFDALPQVLDPPSGFIQNANSSPFTATVGEGNPSSADWDESSGIERGETNRSLRLRALLAADPVLSWQELVAIKFDTRYDPASAIATWRRELLDHRAALEADDPALGDLLEALAAWDLDSGVDDPHTALPVMAWGDLLLPEVVVPSEAELLDRLRHAATALRRYHGGLAVPWGTVNRLHRGSIDLPLAGAPDTVRAIYGKPADDGRLVGWAGDSYILMVRWDADGQVHSESQHPFGSATLDPGSPHYADRTGPFARQQLEPVWLDEADIRAHLEREYRPGER